MNSKYIFIMSLIVSMTLLFLMFFNSDSYGSRERLGMKMIFPQSDNFGMMEIFPLTGNKVTMEEGADHRNGKRYNTNHVFDDYVMQGYFLLGSEQKKLIFKGDGPNHGGCKTIDQFQCLWYEVEVNMSNGKIQLNYEMPHPETTHIDEKELEFVTSVGNFHEKQWVGLAIAYYWDNKGHRNIEAYIDKDPFDLSFEPQNKWILGLHAVEKGQLVDNIKLPRNLTTVMNHEDGLEAELRMHGAKHGDTQMKNAYVFEIDPTLIHS